jgi:hypothetical protein
LQSLRAGAFPARIAHSRKELQAKLVSGAASLVGATIYRDAGQPPVTGALEPVYSGPSGLGAIDLETLAQAVA